MKLRRFLLSKISIGTVTEKKLYYEGSITIDEDIIKKAHINPQEKVEVLNLNNGARIETYVIKGKSGSKEICINGPASRFFEVGDKIIILCYGLVDDEDLSSLKTIFVELDERNNVKNTYLR